MSSSLRIILPKNHLFYTKLILHKYQQTEVEYNVLERKRYHEREGKLSQHERKMEIEK